ncbi:hypothetical protein LX32DRAFT_13765 [Colletotrichum zoysiae]|uniref:Uncharacterized protein n=1 Tax=Colletotrichum zoysiae TaxID=1216348 RepID=A0AAD9HD77_9PEZI|nr:hypothetical protein LX32DRAFT_13765 [Colletotrichum zoysiae]
MCRPLRCLTSTATTLCPAKRWRHSGSRDPSRPAFAITRFWGPAWTAGTLWEQGGAKRKEAAKRENPHKRFGVKQFREFCPCKHAVVTEKSEGKGETDHSLRARLFVWPSSPRSRSIDRVSRCGSQGSSARQGDFALSELRLRSRSAYGVLADVSVANSVFPHFLEGRRGISVQGGEEVIAIVGG